MAIVDVPSSDRSARLHLSRRLLMELRWSVLAGPFGWAIDQIASYASVELVREEGRHWIVHLFTAIGLLMAASGIAVASNARRSLRSYAPSSIALTPAYVEWIATLGIWLSLAFAIVIVALAIPKWLVSPCLH